MNNYQVLYQNQVQDVNLVGPADCGRMFKPAMDADEFKAWARANNCPPDGGVQVNGVVEPAWIRGRVQLRRECVRVSTTRKARRAQGRS